MKLCLGWAFLPPLSPRPRGFSTIPPPQPEDRFHMAPGSSGCSPKPIITHAGLVEPRPPADRAAKEAREIGINLQTGRRCSDYGKIAKHGEFVQKNGECCRHDEGCVLGCRLPWVIILRI